MSGNNGNGGGEGARPTLEEVTASFEPRDRVERLSVMLSEMFQAFKAQEFRRDVADNPTSRRTGCAPRDRGRPAKSAAQRAFRRRGKDIAMTKIYLGTYPAGYSHVAIPQGALEEAVKAANAALDLEHERRRQQVETVAADAARVANTRRARVARRLSRALAALGSRTRR